MNRDLLLTQPLDCDPALPRTVAAFLRRATPTGATPPKIISYVATEVRPLIFPIPDFGALMRPFSC